MAHGQYEFTPLVYPFLRGFQDTAGHRGTARDTKKPASLLSVCDFVRNVEAVGVVCEASALPLSQAGDKFLNINSLQALLDQQITGSYACKRRHLKSSLPARASNRAKHIKIISLNLLTSALRIRRPAKR